MTVIADTGALFALVDSSDAWHQRVIDWWRANSGPVVIPSTVLPELAYLLHTRINPDAEAAFVRALADGEFTTEPFLDEDLPRTADLVERYADLPLGFVDASVAAIAERLEARKLLTTDRQHFGVLRPRHARGFTLLP